MLFTVAACFTMVSHQSFATLHSNRLWGFLIKNHLRQTQQHSALNLWVCMCQYASCMCVLVGVHV